jgi:hypothetical protein
MNRVLKFNEKNQVFASRLVLFVYPCSSPDLSPSLFSFCCLVNLSCRSVWISSQSGLTRFHFCSCRRSPGVGFSPPVGLVRTVQIFTADFCWSRLVDILCFVFSCAQGFVFHFIFRVCCRIPVPPIFRSQETALGLLYLFSSPGAARLRYFLSLNFHVLRSQLLPKESVTPQMSCPRELFFRCQIISQGRVYAIQFSS